MATKKEQLTRMQQKHDIEAHWRLAENFIPMAGEIIVYDPDEVYNYARFKCGDGVTYVNDLPFIIDTDETLSLEGRIADAKATGEAITSIKSTINDLHTTGAEIWLVEATGSTIQRISITETLETEGAIINVEIVDVLPEVLKQSNLQTGVGYIYIVKDTGVGYADGGNGVQTLGDAFIGGGTLFDKGWTDDVNAETETGIYYVRKIGTPNNGIVDVDNELPKTGNDKLIYRVKREDGFTADLWLRGVNNNVAPVNITQNGIAQGITVNTYIVDKLPDTLEKSSQTVMNLYVVDSTGICYVDDGSGIETIGENTFNQKGVDYGWVESVDKMTQTGYYCMRVPVYKYTYHIYKDGKWVELAEKKDITWENLPDKPFGETTVEYGDTVTWDGNIDEGNDVVSTSTPFGNGTARYVKVSDCVPTFEELNSNTTLTYVTKSDNGYNSTDEVVAPRNGSNGYIYMSGGGMKFVAVVPTDNFTQDSTTFPEKGVYFLLLSMDDTPYAYATKLTIPNYSFGTKTTIKKLDEKYLPAWDDLNDKPFGEIKEYGDTLIVFANDLKENQGNLVFDTSKTFVKVSDAAPAIDDFVNGCTLSIPGMGLIEIPYEELLAIYNNSGVVTYEVFIIAPNDNFTIAANEDTNITFPEKGFYIMYDSDAQFGSASITIPDYNGFESIVIKQIDEKYLSILETVKSENVNVGDTLTWDGNTQGYKTVTADFVIGDASISVTYVKVSDSILTKDDLEKGVVVNYSNEASIKHPNSYNNSSIVENENYVSINDASSDDRVIAQAIFAKKAFSKELFENELYIPEAGVWFVMASSKDYPQLSAYTTSLTVTDYNFIRSESKKKVIKSEYLPESAKGIIDVENFPTNHANENVIYRLTKATFYYKQNATLYQQGNVIEVKELPETGLPCTNTGSDIGTLYYNRADNTMYAYVTEELSAGLGAPAGWYPVSVLMETLGYTYGGIVNSKEDMVGSNVFYALLERSYCVYADGKFEVLDTLPVAETANIYLCGNGQILELQSVLDLAYPGTSVSIELVDELVIENMNDESNMGEGATLYVYVLKSTGIAYINMAGQAVKLGVLLNQNANDTSDKGWTNELSGDVEYGFYTIREHRIIYPSVLQLDDSLTKAGYAADAKATGDAFLSLFTEEQLPSVNIGNTLTWDGNLEGKTYSGYTLQANGVTQEMMYIRVSDSVPTIEDLETNGWSVTTVNGKTLDSDNPNLGPTNAIAGLRLMENDQKIWCTDMDGMESVMCFPTILKKSWNIHEEMSDSDLGADASFTLKGDAVLEPGVYFFKGYFVFPNKVTDYQTKSFTLNNYDFLSTSSTKKVIKSDLISVDTALTEAGKPADAKAVGDKFNSYATKENVQKIADELAGVKVTAETARTEEEVNSQIDIKINALNLATTYEPIGAETKAKAYADDLIKDANLSQYTTEQEVKDIVDTVVADAVSGDAVTGLTNLVEYFHEHGEEAAQMGAAIDVLEGDVKNLKEAPSAGIKTTDISAWNNEIGAKVLAATKTTTEEVKTQIEAYGYAKKVELGSLAAKSTVTKSDLDSTVQASLNKADTALQTHQSLADYAKKTDIPTVPTKVSAFENDKGYLTSYTEADPTVPDWAKAASKPTYTKSEVGLSNVDNVKQYSASNPPPYPVTSVAGKTGAVTLAKGDVGLGNVVNTGDSATPVSGGTTKFTTGGAYTELAKKVDKVDGKGLSTNDFTDEYKEHVERAAGIYYSEGLNYILKDNGEYRVAGMGTCTDTDIVIPSVYNGIAVTTVSDWAFSGRSQLTSIIIPSSIVDIQARAFNDCSNLTEVTIGTGITSIGIGAFGGCSKLTNIIIPDSVTSIDSSAFEDCDSLTSVVIPDSVVSMKGSIFYNTNNVTVYCEASSKPEGWASNWNNSNRPVVWGAVLDFAGVNEKLADIPTKTSELTNDSNYVTQSDLETYINNAILGGSW